MNDHDSVRDDATDVHEADAHGAGDHAEPHSGPVHGAASASSRRLAAVAAINLLGFAGELAGGLLFGSVALLSDAFHMLFDALAYVMAFAASYVADTYEGERWSYGLHRLEPVAAFLNGVLLLPMVGYILWESYRRFLDPVALAPVPTLAVAAGGLLVNLGSVYVLKSEEMSLNERGAFYHLLGDAGGSVAVIVSTVAVAVFDLPIADPAAAALIGLLVLWSAGKVLRGSASVLLDRSPLPPGELRTELTGLNGVERVEDLHVWQVCSQLTVATVRVVDSAASLAERRAVRGRIHDALAARGVDHATVECLDTAAEDRRPDRTTHSH